ncbi:hypothetical protein TRVL_05742 [Trypanosoma vivax]|uniref:Uncharacterized protein n=1 Tax=Trypanosoma vivax (strain Y486) TaxID=1055687 RepID=G0U608_TRYVY|nr:hypothetical protein TRVL_05742 [Trypanosoma vivax]CCC51309.1 hypothetical protein, unlikely [Trypanosoma vivax Y486]
MELGEKRETLTLHTAPLGGQLEVDAASRTITILFARLRPDAVISTDGGCAPCSPRMHKTAKQPEVQDGDLIPSLALGCCVLVNLPDGVPNFQKEPIINMREKGFFSVRSPWPHGPTKKVSFISSSWLHVPNPRLKQTALHPTPLPLALKGAFAHTPRPR